MTTTQASSAQQLATTPRPAPAVSDDSSPASAERHKQLEQLAAAVEKRATVAGVPIEYLGTQPLFTNPRLYPGPSSPWLVCPAAVDPIVRAGLPIPGPQRRRLDQLVQVGLDFPHIYLAHELGKKSSASWRPDLTEFRVLDKTEIDQLIVRPDAPARTRRTATRIDRSAAALGRAIGTAAVGAAIAAGAAIALVADGLDPAILGAITLPDQEHKPREANAAWFLLANWDW